jgi:hypothetical protein
MGPSEFGQGVVKGTTALASGVATGVTGGVSKVVFFDLPFFIAR